jgi:hypothetical protein
MANYFLIVLTCFYLPVFIIRAIVIRFFGATYGIKVLDDLLNPCISSHHHDAHHDRPSKQHRRKTEESKSPKECKEVSISKRPSKTLSRVTRRSIEEELALSEQTLQKIEGMQQKKSYSKEPRSHSRSRPTKELLSEELL